MTYAETIEYLYARLPMFTRIGAAAYKKDLHNTVVLLDALGNPHHQFKSIHIAGTNGKGSTSHMMAAIMQQHGYKTGLYTSPHLVDFRERIKIDGEWISEDFVNNFTANIKPLIESIEPSFFEVTVAMAFAWFAQQQVDIAIIETGLGGRLDSTNVITPELSIITNIGWDHMNILGDTLGKIAFEKAGIIKPGIPAVIGETTLETKGVFAQKAEQEHSPITWAENTYSITQTQLHPTALHVTLTNNATGQPKEIITDLCGLYQQYNLRAVITATDILIGLGWPLKASQIAHALTNVIKLTGLHGRWEVLQQHPAVVLDVAHNEHGMRQVLAQINMLLQQYPNMRVHWIMGMVKDKDVSKVLALLPKDFEYYFTQAQLPRALAASELQQLAGYKQLQGPHFPNVNDALQSALSKAGRGDLIMVCGSVFVVGEVDRSKI